MLGWISLLDFAETSQHWSSSFRPVWLRVARHISPCFPWKITQPRFTIPHFFRVWIHRLDGLKRFKRNCKDESILGSRIFTIAHSFKCGSPVTYGKSDRLYWPPKERLAEWNHALVQTQTIHGQLCRRLRKSALSGHRVRKLEKWHKYKRLVALGSLSKPSK